ncbi:MAG: hypothetical protein R3E14_12995 [Erythrobacter sp.]
MIRQTLLFALPLVLAGCNNSEPEPVRDAPAKTVDRASQTDPQLDGAKIVVDANGFGAKGATPLRFGVSRAEADAVAARAFGAKGEESSNAECGAGPMDFSTFGPLQVAYLDGKLAGWFLREGEGVVTSDGIRPGITLEALKEERQLRQIDSTLPGEFAYTTADYGTIRGFAEGGKITALQAGVSCFFR